MLYHYTSKKSYAYISEHNTIRFSNYSLSKANNLNKNDDFDGQYSIEKILETINLYSESKEDKSNDDFDRCMKYISTNCKNENYKNWLIRYVEYIVNNDLFFLCTSKNRNNMVLAKEFAECDGYIIEIDEKELMDYDSNLFIIRQVTYFDFNKNINIEHISAVFGNIFSIVKEFKSALDIKGNIFSNEKNEFSKEFCNDVVTLFLAYAKLLIKVPDKACEEETRIIINMKFLKDNRIIRFGNMGQMIPFFPNFGYIHYISNGFNNYSKYLIRKAENRKEYDYYEDEFNFYENNIKELFKIENVTIDDINNYRTTINNHFFISMEKFNIKSIRITVAKEKMYVIKYYEN